MLLFARKARKYGHSPFVPVTLCPSRSLSSRAFFRFLYVWGNGKANDQIPNYVLEAIHQVNIVGAQGKRNPRTIYEFVYNGVTQRIAVQVSTNGYIVVANPKSMKE